ncbi:MAG: site-specific DNA-methyltransferase [Alphaproteobacteria bacterium]|nr:site-specific DNA-methyltransferase [Alphaproteobacteria bacterium]
MIIPYYKNDLITLYHGDCLEIMPQLDIKFDCCITDPPYGTTACKWDSVIPFEPMWDNLKRLVKSSGAICLFGSEPFSSYLRISNIEMFKYDWIWNKKTGLGFLDSKFRPLKSHEIISIFSKGGCSNGSNPAMNYFPQDLIKTTKQNSNSKSNILNSEPTQRKNLNTEYTNYPKTIISYSRVSGLHPTQKPVPLIEYLIKTYTNENDIVLDFTSGSGTTGVAAMETSRKCVLIEKEEKYCEITIKRLQDKEDEIKQRLF